MHRTLSRREGDAMSIRPHWLVLVCACLGCQTLAAPTPTAAEADVATQVWEQGQEAMRRGQPREAIGLYQRSLALDAGLTRNHLSLAAAYLEQGDQPAACVHLRKYVRSNPHHLAARIHLADLQLRLQRWTDARLEFERCIASAQDLGEPADGPLLHCHARLMEIAEEAEDSYHEHLHRGIGLCLLACQRAALPDPDGEMSAESLLCKAAGELTLAQEDRPHEARPSWYLYRVWDLLDQRQTALRCLRQAADTAPFSQLTAAEKRLVQVQCQCAAQDTPVK